MPLILDTNIVRHLAEGELPVDGLYALRSEGTSLHLSEGVAVELVAQIVEERLAWDRWLRARRILRELLCQRRPILLGREIRNRRSVFAQPPDEQYAVDNPAYQHRTRYSWLSVVGAKRPSDLLRPFRVPPTGQDAVLGLANITAAMERTRQSWIEAFQTVASHLGSEGGRAIDRARITERLTEMADRFAHQIDSDVPGQQPPESVRWDAVVRVMSLFAIRSLVPKQPYNAQKNRNDSFDFDLLRYLAVPAAICTRDRRLRSVLADAGAWQAAWVVTPESLLTRAGRQVVADLRWPDQG